MFVPFSGLRLFGYKSIALNVALWSKFYAVIYGAIVVVGFPESAAQRFAAQRFAASAIFGCQAESADVDSRQAKLPLFKFDKWPAG